MKQFTPDPASDEDKLRWEVAKLKAETVAMARPWILLPASWLSIATTAVAAGAFTLQFLQNRREASLNRQESLLSETKVQEAKAEKLNYENQKFALAGEIDLLKQQKKIGHTEVDNLRKQVEPLRQAIRDAKKDPSRLKDAEAIVNSLAGAAKSVAASLNRPVFLSTIWLEIANEDQRADAARLSTAFQQVGVKVNATEDVGRIKGVEIPEIIEVRYGHDVDPKNAEFLGAITRNVFPSTTVKVGYEPFVRETNNIQIWFPTKVH